MGGGGGIGGNLAGPGGTHHWTTVEIREKQKDLKVVAGRIWFTRRP